MDEFSYSHAYQWNLLENAISAADKIRPRHAVQDSFLCAHATFPIFSRNGDIPA